MRRKMATPASPTGGIPGNEGDIRPKLITCPCCDSVVFRNGELKKKGARMIELEKAERENENLNAQVTDLRDKLREHEITPPAPPTPEPSPAPAPAPASERRGFLVR